MSAGTTDNLGASENRILEEFGTFLVTLGVYERIAAQIPVGRRTQELARAETFPASLAPLDEHDVAALSVRMMLQRKYFTIKSGETPKKTLIRVLLSGLLACFPEEVVRVQAISEQLDKVNHAFELTLPDGSQISGLYRSVEEVLYGTMLHSDIDKARRFVQMPYEEWIGILAWFVLGRERIITSLGDLLRSKGVAPIEGEYEDRAASVFFDEKHTDVIGAEAGYWANLHGRVASEDEISRIVSKASDEDSQIQCVSFAFITELSKPHPDCSVMKRLVTKGAAIRWGDFREVARQFQNIDSPGVNSRVRHKDSGKSAEVWVYQKVTVEMMIQGAQITESPAKIQLRKTRSGWRVRDLIIPETMKRSTGD